MFQQTKLIPNNFKNGFLLFNKHITNHHHHYGRHTIVNQHNINGGFLSTSCCSNRSYAVIMNKTVQVTKPKAADPSKTKSNFAKSQDKLKKQKIQQVQQRTEKDYISDKIQLEKTLLIQELVAKYAILKKQSTTTSTTTTTTTTENNEQTENHENHEQFQIEFYRKLVQFPNFIYMNMLEAGSSTSSSDSDSSILGNINIFTSKLKYDQYIERFESKLLKKEYASVKISNAPNIAQILAATSSTSSLDVLTATIDDTIKLLPSELKQIMEWTSIIWSELLYSVLIKSFKEHLEIANEIKNLDIQLQNVSHEIMTKQNKGSFMAVQNKYKKLIEEKVKLLQDNEVKSSGYKSRLYLTEKMYVAQLSADDNGSGSDSSDGSVDEVDRFAIPSRKDPSKKIVHIYSAPDVAIRDVHNFKKSSERSNGSNSTAVSIAIVSGSELFEFLVKNKVDLLRIAFLGNYDELVTHKLTLSEIEEIVEIGRREKRQEHSDGDTNTTNSDINHQATPTIGEE